MKAFHIALARKIATAVAAALLLSAGAAVAADVEELLFDLQIVPMDGEQPPDFVLPGLQGGKVALSDLRGRVALLYFWATW